MRAKRLFKSFLLSAFSLGILIPQFLNAQPVDPLNVWTSRNGITGFTHFGAAYGNTTFVVVGSSGLILSSSDGATWTTRTSPINLNLNAVAFGNGIFVAVGDSGTVLTSPDGVNWTSRGPVAPNHLRGVAFGNDLFVAVGDAGTIRTSTDGVTWNPGDSGTAFALFGVTHGGGRFVIVGSLGVFVTSVNGANWTPGATGASFDLNGVAHGSGVFVAVGNGGAVFTSTNGTSWNSQISGTTNNLQSVAIGNGPFVAVGNTGTIRTSPDGVTWTQRTSGTGLSLNGVGYGEGTYVATGASGTILQSNPIIAFNDVPLSHFAFAQIDTIALAGLTGGCLLNPPLFCPDNSITRGEMAVFVELSLGNPLNACIGRFTDVPPTHPFCGFIERLAADGVTGGCTPTQFCPDAPVSRGQMAVFIQAALENPANICTGRFTDVPIGHPFCGFIERLSDDGITGGCGGGNFCPNAPVTRGQMAVFLVAAPTPLDP
jgi:hypothetical protein